MHDPVKSHVLYAAGANPCSSSTAPTVPDTPCKKWEARAKANKAVALALKSEVGFGDNSIQLSSSGKKTLNKVANVLKKYPWMKIAVEAHSDAPAGSTCRRLTAGRAASTEKYLKSQGVSNPMAKPKGKCGVKKAVVIAIAGFEQYMSGSKGANSCSNGKLASESSCKAAAAALGYTYKKSETDRAFPAGCYEHSKKAYFNKADPGKAHSKSTPLCKGVFLCGVVCTIL